MIEILTPGDETYDKLPFYAAHGVEEVLVVDPPERRLRVLVLAGDHYQDASESTLLTVRAGDLEAAIRWP